MADLPWALLAGASRQSHRTNGHRADSDPSRSSGLSSARARLRRWDSRDAPFVAATPWLHMDEDTTQLLRSPLNGTRTAREGLVLYGVITTDQATALVDGLLLGAARSDTVSPAASVDVPLLEHDVAELPVMAQFRAPTAVPLTIRV